jgi:hypothetical protein
MLIRLLHEQVDPNPGLRARTALAILPGGNLTGPAADGTPGVLPHLPACTRTGQAGCVIAYSSYSHAPPVGSIFGRPASVVCVNPAAPAGGGGALDPAFPVTAGPSGTAGRPGPRGTARPAQTPWVRYPGLYTARCRTAGGATWLQVDTPAAAADPRPRVAESDGPAWGWHAEDVNLALGNLVADVAAAVRTWQAVHR